MQESVETKTRRVGAITRGVEVLPHLTSRGVEVLAHLTSDRNLLAHDDPIGSPGSPTHRVCMRALVLGCAMEFPKLCETHLNKIDKQLR